MATQENKQRIYLKSLKDLRDLINEDYQDRGKLPSERVMCDRLGISRMTYRKVLGWLVKEGLVKTVPSRGHWVVPEYQRCHKIGIVLANGGESPFLHGELLPRICTGLMKHGYFTQLIQASPLENISFATATHAIEGLIWILPPAEAFDYIKTIHDTMKLPVLAVFEQLFKLEESIKHIPYIGLDNKIAIQHAADYFREKGYKRIVYLAQTDSEYNQLFASILQNAGLPFDTEQIITDEDNVKERLTYLTEKYEISAVFAEGFGELIESMLHYYSLQPKQKRPDIILPKIHWLPKLLAKFSEIEISAFRKGNYHELTEKTVEIMVNRLKNNSPIVSQTVQNYHIINSTIEEQYEL